MLHRSPCDLHDPVVDRVLTRSHPGPPPARQAHVKPSRPFIGNRYRHLGAPGTDYGALRIAAILSVQMRGCPAMRREH